eukprot:9198872-Alexandrium_andersonii.AAC.1
MMVPELGPPSRVSDSEHGLPSRRLAQLGLGVSRFQVLFFPKPARREADRSGCSLQSLLRP